MEMYLKMIGFHILPTEEQLFDILGRKIRKEGGGDAGMIMASHADDHDFPFPIVDRDLYSREPWELFTDEDPWEVDDSGVKRTLYVFTTLKPTGKNSKRFARVAGAGTWDGSTGKNPVHVNGGSDHRLVIGSKRYLDYKPKPESSAGTIREGYGHWMMHEYSLAGESLKGLETTLLPLAKVRVLCKISQVVDIGSLAHCLWPKEPLDRCLEEYISQGLFETCVIMNSCNEDSDHRLAAAATNKRECLDHQENLQQENVQIKRRRIVQNQEEEEKGYSTKSSTLTESETCNLLDSKEEEEEEEDFAASLEKSLMTETENCNLFDSKEKEEEEVPIPFEDNSVLLTKKAETCSGFFESKEQEEGFGAFVDDSIMEEIMQETSCNMHFKYSEEEYAVLLDNLLNGSCK